MRVTKREQEFDKVDWYGYSGAVEKNGHAPLIAQFVDEKDANDLIDLLLSYCEPEPDTSEDCTVDLSTFKGDEDKNVYLQYRCSNWDEGYDLFKSVYKEMQNKSFDEVIGSMVRKGFESQLT